MRRWMNARRLDEECFVLHAVYLKLKPGFVQLDPGSLELKPGSFYLKPGSLHLNPGILQIKDGFLPQAWLPTTQALMCTNQA